MSLRMVKKLLICSLLVFVSGKGYARDCDLIGTKGLKGEELVCIAVSPIDQNIILIGTDKSLYKRNLGIEDNWEPINGFPSQKNRVSQIYFSSFVGRGYAATEKGLYVLAADLGGCEKIFYRSDEAEGDCLSVCDLKDGSILVGTRKGMFVKSSSSQEWVKVLSPFENEEIMYIHGAGGSVYVAARSGVYRSQELLNNWEKVFNVYSDLDVAEDDPDMSDSIENGEEGKSMIKHMTGIPDDPSILYVCADNGVFLTQDSGKNWRPLSSSGLDAAAVRYLLVGPLAEKVFAVAKDGVYEFQKEEWKIMAVGYDCRQAAKKGLKLLLLTSRDIFECDLPDGPLSMDALVAFFDDEPSIEEVQKMAVNYAEVSDQKIRGWRKRANLKAVMPEVSLNLDKTIATAVGASYQKVLLGPTDWGVSLKWDLADLVYNPDQTSIDVRSKLMVQLRNDILSEVTRLYFERRKLQIELTSEKEISPQQGLDKKLRLLELTALMDRLTGGRFSKVLKSPR